MKREYSRRKQPKTSSHKVQNLQAAVSFHGCCNRFCAVVADLVGALHSTRQRWRTTIKKETKIQQKKTTQNFISQGPESASCCFLPRLLQSILRRRRRFGCRSAQHTSALAQRAANNTRKIHSRNRTGKKYYKVQCLHSADFARFHPRGEQSEVRSWNTTAVRINLLGVDVEFHPAQLHLRHGMVYAAADAGPE